MGPEKTFTTMSRAFCTAFKHYLYPSQTTVTSAVCCGTSRQPKLASTLLIWPSFCAPSARFAHRTCNKGTGHSSLVVAKVCSIQSREFQRGFCSSSDSPPSPGPPPRRQASLQRVQALLQNLTKMLGGGRTRRRSLRLSSQSPSPRREPLSIINNVANLNNGFNVNENRPITVAIEGNIGSGKTTLLKYFQSQNGVQVVQEPVEKWRAHKGANMLDLLYRDPTRWSFAFQSFVQLTMMQQHQIPHTAPIKVMERSLFSAKYCFVENLYRSKKMNSSEYMVLTEWFDWIVDNQQDLQVDQIVYLRTTPEMCKKRIRHRCRSEEEGIPMQYLEELHELHEDWLIKGNKFKLPAPVMVLDASKPLEQMFQTFDEQRDQILLQSS